MIIIIIIIIIMLPIKHDVHVCMGSQVVDAVEQLEQKWLPSRQNQV
jgi:hypothetical protein